MSTGTTTTPLSSNSGASVRSASPQKFKGFPVPRILSWENPSETGVLLAETLGLFILLGSTFTLRYFLKTSSLVIGLLSVAEWGSRSISGQRSGLVSSYQPSRFLPLNDKVVNDVASYVSYAVHRATSGVQHFLDARSPVQGFKVSASLYVAYVLLGLLPLRTLVLSAIIIAFSVPPLYLQFKPEVDKLVNDLQEHLHHHARNVSAQIHEKAGPQIEYAKKLLGPRGGFDSSKDVRPVGAIPTAGAIPTEHTSNRDASHHDAGVSTSSTGNVYTSTVKPVVTPDVGASAGANTATAKAASSTHVPDEVFKNFDSVPTLTGNVPIDHEKLNAALAADRAKAEGALSGL